MAEVDFHGWTHGDRVRQASFQGLREDKPAKQVVREVKTMAAKAKAAVKRSAPARNAKATVGGVTLSHPDRVYWADAGVSKRDLAEFYAQIWKWMRPHVVGRPIALLRCPEGAAGQCFFQKHATMGIATEHLHLIPEKGDKIISIDDLAGLIALVQAGVLEVHTRGTTVDDRERADRLVFDLDPGPGTGWKDVVAAAREVRERLARVEAQELRQDLRRQGPARRAADQADAVGRRPRISATPSPPAWRRTTRTATRRPPPRANATSAFSSITCATAARRRRSRPTPPARGRARRCRRRSTGPNLARSRAPNQYTVLNLPARLNRLRKDPWAAIGRLRQTLPG